ncbi:STAS-like domain-containing protein [Pectobacterium polaris]|uniref:STAS-like domain-containing protein n=1 Tax=Pectobacterium polaris TaxID=2042057 RepID=UPI0023B11874|nr:STAS-like domain-containing protein [Pectobacterium polaris]MDE8742532.1 STAS-like domain-containing protein [Pectobacterium polaris]
MSYINVAKEFSRTPFGRDEHDGPNNGTRFRKEKLLPELRENEGHESVITVDFNGITLVIGSSFFEEAFGGLVRIEHYNKNDLLKKFKIIANTPIYEIQIKRFITEADKNQ